MRAAVEFYWPGLGGKVADQWREWNRDLFDGALRPAPMVLSRMSSVYGHWFCTMAPSADQRLGFEPQLAVQNASYSAPRAITSVRRIDLLRQMLHRLRAQDGLAPFKSNSTEWCELIMDLHSRLTGKRIWAAPVQEKTTPMQDLGKGLWRPAQTRTWQDRDPATGAESLPKDKIASWPHGLIELGVIVREGDGR
jgi:hypothetical protein